MARKRKTGGKAPVPSSTESKSSVLGKSDRDDTSAFLQRVAQTPVRVGIGSKGRLIFALDATMSREPTWDAACAIQGAMFNETAAIGGLGVQLVYFRGFREFHASPWASDPNTLLNNMTGIQCRAGHTQIERVLGHVLHETKQQGVNALVYVGDCFEEDIDGVCAVAGELGLSGVPAFMFQEGRVPIAERAYREIARLTGGAYCNFSQASAKALRDLLSAVAVYAAGGRKALADYGKEKGGEVLLLAKQVR